MPQWCPECSALLPDHLEFCARCHANLKQDHAQGFQGKDIFQISAVIIGVALIPIIVIILIGIVCVNIY